MAWSTILLPAVAIIFSSLIKDSCTQSITQPPINTAARVGSSAQLNCTANLASDVLAWSHFIGSTTPVRIFDSNAGNVQDPRFDVLRAGNGEYDLVIRNAQSEVAGLYQCALLIQNVNAEVEFVTVSGMSVSPTPGTREVVENTEITLSCDVTFHGYKAPTMEWYNAAGTLLPTTTTPDANNQQRHIATTNLTANANHDLQEFECRLKFVRESADTADAPTYTDHINTHFMVLHAVTNVMIHPDPDNAVGGKINVDIGDQINCTASGRPAPTYYWYSDDGSDIIPGQFLEIRENMAGEHIYRCEATNFISGVERKAQKSVTFIASAPSPPPSTTGGGTAPWIIAVAVVVPIILIVAILAGVFVALKRQNKLPEKLQNFGNFPPAFGPGAKNNGVGNPAVPPNTGAGHPVGAGPRPNPDFQPARGPGGGPPQREMSRGPGMGGVAVIPPGAATDQQLKRGRDSPGYGDLGIRHFGGSNPGLDHNVSMDMDSGPVYSQPHKPQPGPPGHDNRVFRPSPGSQRHPMTTKPGHDSVV